MTATITETDTGLDTAVLDRLDFKASLACENITTAGRKCENEAEWVIRHNCCEVTKLLCNFHKELLISLASRFRVTHNARFGGCGKSLEIKSIDRI